MDDDRLTGEPTSHQQVREDLDVAHAALVRALAQHAHMGLPALAHVAFEIAGSLGAAVIEAHPNVGLQMMNERLDQLRLFVLTGGQRPQ